MGLKDGYDTNINSGIKRSVFYLLAIARVIIKDSKIMIFDESLSLIDKKDIEVVKNILLELKENHTIIVIDREQNVDSISDYIVVIDEHVVKEEGTREELLKKQCDGNKGANTVIIVTHNSLFAEIADTVIRVKNGKIESVTPNENPKKIDEVKW